MQYSFSVCSRPKAAIDVISGMLAGLVVPDKCLKFRDPRLHTVLEKFHPKPSEAAFSTGFRNNFRPHVVSEIISGVVVE